ncbi:MAG TPA: amidohydrolase family protein [Bryobacteraceae bacterium]|nr:amidohydrolase family protein [Bryobacteraceae bacterium]
MGTIGRIFWLATLLVAGSSLAAAEVKVLRGFTLIDGTGRPPLAPAALIVADGRIRWVGPESQLKVPAGAEVIELGGKFVMPGIINLHGHLGNTVGLAQDPKNFTRANVENQLRIYAAYGVTSVVSMGTDQDLIFQIRAEQRAGRPALTRVFTAGRGFTGKGGYPTSVPGMKGIPYEVGSPAEAEKAVAELANRKVDIIKIWVDDHLGREQKIPMELCRAIIESAHKRGIKVAAHIFYLEDARRLVEMGLDGLAHSVRDKAVDGALIAAMKKRGAWQAAPTLTRELSTFVYAEDHPSLGDPFFTRSVPDTIIRELRNPERRKRIASDPDFPKYPAFLRQAQENLKKLADAGVRFAFGTDTGPPARFQGYFEHWEMELMAEAGLKPADIIRAATANAAEFLGVARDLGTLETGKWADLIVLSKNPLEDIRNTRTLEMVFIAGNRVL